MQKFWLMILVMATLIVVGMATMQEDEEDCADQMVNLAACIPFVSGNEKKPTTECCENTKQVRAAKPKCLCVLIKESTDPSMGLPVNTSLALQMPSACKLDAKVSDCPSILKLPPGSPDAKIFQTAEADSNTTSTTDSPSASGYSSTDSSKSPTPMHRGSSGSETKASTTSSSTGTKLASSMMMFIGVASVALLLS